MPSVFVTFEARSRPRHGLQALRLQPTGCGMCHQAAGRRRVSPAWATSAPWTGWPDISAQALRRRGSPRLALRNGCGL